MSDPDRKRILVVDDEPGFTEMVKLNLEATELYIVRVENNPAQALETALIFHPDLILLDVIMPDIEGPDIVCELRNNKKTQNIPIVFLTATITKDEVYSQKGKIGGHEFLAKPTTLHELLDCLNRHLG